MAHLAGRERARYVTRMFGRIAGRYDLLNAVMSGGRHHVWRRMAVEMGHARLEGPALDVAAGTGDFALEIARNSWASHVIALDNTLEMLSVAAKKARRGGLLDKLQVVSGDAHFLPFPNDRFICVTVGFGVRNFVDVPQALREMARVVRPGGRVVILEIFRLEGRGLLGRLFPLYFRTVAPWLGALLAGDREAYSYLPKSVETFLSVDELSALMEQAGLIRVSYRRLALGAVAVHVGEKPEANS